MSRRDWVPARHGSVVEGPHLARYKDIAAGFSASARSGLQDVNSPTPRRDHRNRRGRGKLVDALESMGRRSSSWAAVVDSPRPTSAVYLDALARLKTMSKRSRST